MVGNGLKGLKISENEWKVNLHKKKVSKWMKMVMTIRVTMKKMMIKNQMGWPSDSFDCPLFNLEVML